MPPFNYLACMYDICCIGHITADRVINTKTTMDMPGGTAMYFSCALSKFDLNYLLVTSIGAPEMKYVTDLQDLNLEVQAQIGGHTVYFENIYAEDQNQRTQNVLQKADPFTTEQISAVEAKIFHLGPLLADDLPPEFVQSLVGKGLISVDVQGYLRKVVDKKVYAAEWLAKDVILPYVDILKADVVELKALTGCDGMHDGARQIADYGVKELVITDGSHGSTIYTDGKFYTIPAFETETMVDATGCGDTYMAGYLYKRVKGAGIQESGEFSAAMSGLKTASAGPFMGTEEDVRRFLLKKKFDRRF